MEDELLNVASVASILKVNKNMVYNLINKGLIPVLKVGSIKVRKSSLIHFMEEYEGKDLSDLDNIKELKF